MDWKKVGEAVAGTAPLLGRLLLGPVGGAAGEMISTVFGSKPEPDAVLDAMKADPQALLKLKEFELNHRLELERLQIEAARVQIEEDTKRIQSTNSTMQVEAKSEHWPQWAWRPFWGFVSGLAFLFVCVLVCILAYKAVLGGKPEAMTMIPQLIGAFAALFAIPGAILGVTAWHRGKMKRNK